MLPPVAPKTDPEDGGRVVAAAAAVHHVLRGAVVALLAVGEDDDRRARRGRRGVLHGEVRRVHQRDLHHAEHHDEERDEDHEELDVDRTPRVLHERASVRGGGGRFHGLSSS
jgi:hypothetical protein